MERTEFLRGWLLLTTQPWGKPYRTQAQSLPGTEPSPAEIQAELYYKSLQYSYVPSFLEACELLATGDHWPSITELKETLRHTKAQPPQAKQLNAPGPTYITKDEFGVDLYEAVKTASAIAYCRKQYPDRVKKLEEELQALLPKIQNPQDVRRILSLSSGVHAA